MKAKLLSLIIIMQLLIFGCSATGPMFKEVPVEDYKGKAIVYFYRNSFTGGGNSNDFRVNEGKTMPIKNKGYYLLILDPGAYNFQVFYDNKLKVENKFNFKADEVHYIRFLVYTAGTKQLLIGVATVPGYKITSDPRDEAMEVLKQCHLMGVIDKDGVKEVTAK